MIAVVGVAGVLAFSVSGRTREFGIRLAVGSRPRNLLIRVMAEGAAMAIAGLTVGFASGFGLAQLAGRFLGDLKIPGLLPVAGSALVLLLAAGAWFVSGSTMAMLAVLVASCPCALVLAAPATSIAAIAVASRHGILVKGAAFLENLATVDAVIFDKTGTEIGRASCRERV